MTEYPEITFNEDGNVVSIWGGTFRTQQELDSYLEPFYSTEPETDAKQPARVVFLGSFAYDPSADDR
jgi:hypothetical protein